MVLEGYCSSGRALPPIVVAEEEAKKEEEEGGGVVSGGGGRAHPPVAGLLPMSGCIMSLRHARVQSPGVM